MKLPVIVLLSTLLAPALAGSCTDIGVAYRCGKVINSSKKTMSYTTDPNNKNAPNFCRFWNWSDGPSNALVPCTQQPLAPGGTKGCGYCSTKGTDVDAFTFATSDYDWQGQRITKGVWTKINDLTTAKCTGSGIPDCY